MVTLGFFSRLIAKSRQLDPHDCSDRVRSGVISNAEVQARWAELERRFLSGRLIAGNREEIETIAAIFDVSTHAFAEAVVKDSWPTFFLKDVPDEVQEAWIAGLSTPLTEADASMLDYLGWCGNDEARRVVSSYAGKVLPPDFHPDYIQLCAHAAGWQPHDDGSVTTLVYPRLIPFRRLAATDTAPADTAVIGGVLAADCPQCGGALITGLSIPEGDPRFDFLAVDHDICIPICMNCHFYEFDAGAGHQAWIRLEPGGAWQIDDAEEPHDVPVSDEESDKDDAVQWIAVSDSADTGVERNSVWRNYATGWDEPSIGGHPTWLQEAQYLACPDCGKTMKHLAQIPVDALFASGGYEPVLYIQLCRDCMIAGVVPQTT